MLFSASMTSVITSRSNQIQMLAVTQFYCSFPYWRTWVDPVRPKWQGGGGVNAVCILQSCIWAHTVLNFGCWLPAVTTSLSMWDTMAP